MHRTAAHTATAGTPLAALIGKRGRLAGSLSGGIRETQELLDVCARPGIAPAIGPIASDRIDDACGRMLKADARYVSDRASLRA